nr:tRNA lysidine(34) synthetase TilS [Gordonia araii]
MTAAVAAFADRYLEGRRSVCVALSGGPDSLALTAAAVCTDLNVTALIVDHGLQPRSSAVAREAADAAEGLGAGAIVLPVTVGTDGGMEAAARTARYAALEEARAGRPVLLGHTLDDQAETVLLGLARGSGPTSLSGMRPWRAPWGRPLLALRRADTVAACAQWGLSPVADPHNTDPRFTRVRVRTEVLPLMDEVLGGGVREALARTADLLAADNELLDELAGELARTCVAGDGLAVGPLEQAPAALRTRVLHRWLGAIRGADDAESARPPRAGPTQPVVAAVDALVSDWRGQGPVAVGGDQSSRVVVERVDGVLRLAIQPRG